MGQVNAVRFKRALDEAEAASDALLAKYTALMAAAQAVNGLKFGEVHAVYADIAEAMNIHLQGRLRLAQAHAKSLEIAMRRDLVPSAWGDTIPTFETQRDAPVRSEAPLRAVA